MASFVGVGVESRKINCVLYRGSSCSLEHRTAYRHVFCCRTCRISKHTLSQTDRQTDGQTTDSVMPIADRAAVRSAKTITGTANFLYLIVVN